MSAGRSGPGLDLVRTGGSFPTTLASGEHMAWVLACRITDCGSVPEGPWPIPIRVQRFWGEQTLEVIDVSGRWHTTMVELCCDPPP